MIDTSSKIFHSKYLQGEAELQNFILYLLKGGIPKQSRDAVGRAAAMFVQQKTAAFGLDVSGAKLNEANRESIESLRNEGYALANSAFPPAAIPAIEQFIESLRVNYGYIGHDEEGQKGEIHLADLPPNVRFAHYRSEEICACPEIYKAVHDPRLINAMTIYLGAPPTISSVSLWWSFPSTQEAGGMQKFHHDRGDFRSCNLFVYLTDVSEDTGPHTFVPRTHSFNVLQSLALERFGRDKALYREFWQWIEIHRKSDEEILKWFHKNEIKVFTGPKGTAFFEDTRGLHKATLPISGPRLAFEIVYSTLPKYTENIVTIPREKSKLRHGDRVLGSARTIRDAANLFVTQSTAVFRAHV